MAFFLLSLRPKGAVMLLMMKRVDSLMRDLYIVVGSCAFFLVCLCCSPVKHSGSFDVFEAQ